MKHPFQRACYSVMQDKIKSTDQSQTNGTGFNASALFAELSSRPGGLSASDAEQRLEKYGPTLYLPETIVAPSRKFQGKPLKAVLTWLIIHSLFTLGVHPNQLAR